MNGKRYLLDTNAVIAATALINGCEVITNDTHFAHQRQVQARTYDLRIVELIMKGIQL